MNQSETKICQNCKQQFTIEPEDFKFYEKIKVSPPTFCWKCRFQRRLAYRNERRVFWNVSAKSDKRILSLYPPESGVTVYDDEEWVSDDWDGLLYGRDYDFSRPFFEQFHELAKKVPRQARSTEGNINSDYLINTGWSKNCYLVVNTTGAEDCAYGNAIDYCKNCFDNSHITKCERSYGSFWIRNSYQSHFSTRSIENTSVWFCFGSKGLTNCFGCVNLINKSYYIYNQPYTKEEYERRIGAMRLNTWFGLRKARAEAVAFSKKFPVAYLNGVFHDDVTGEYIGDSKNVHYGYLVNGGRDLKYVQYLQVPGAEDSYDLTIWGHKNVRAYENTSSGWGISNSKFCVECWNEIIDTEYSMMCRSSSHLFGCFGLRKKQYCIFNKQYSKEEYETLRKKIVEHMNTMPYIDKRGRVYTYGESFPVEHSPFGYNVSLVMEFFPLTKEQAIQEGYPWFEEKKLEYQATLKPEQIPDAIEDVPASIVKEILECINCKQAYRILNSEYEFLKAEKIPIPRMCVDCRHNERIEWRSKPFLYHRKCECAGKTSSNGVYANLGTHAHGADACPEEFETVHEAGNGEIIYCLKCFWQEVS